MKSSNYSFINLVAHQVAERVNSHFFKKKKNVIPQRIGEYVFVKKLTRQTIADDVTVSLYKDRSNKLFVVKIWENKFKTYSYYSIKNEYAVHKSVYAAYLRKFRSSTLNTKDIKIPRLVKYFESRNKIILISEWISGKTLYDLGSSTSINSYLHASNFLDEMYKEMTEDEKNSIALRSKGSYIFLFPLLLTVNIFRYPSLRKKLTRILPLIDSTFLRLLSNTELSLVHRDLHFSNLIQSSKFVYIIDFQLACRTFKVCEYANTLRFCWDKDFFKKELFDLIRTLKLGGNDEYRMFKMMTIFFAIQGLTATNFSHQTIARFKNYLDFAFNL